MAHKPTAAFDLKTFLARVGSEKTVTLKPRKKEILFSQGDTADSVFFIVKGKVKLTVLSAKGKEAVIAILGPGDFLGETCLVTGQLVRMATATCIIEDSAVVRIKKNVMLRALRDEPAFLQIFMTHLLSRNMQIEEALVDQLFNSSEKRLARALLLMAHFGKDGMVETAIPKLSQETLAEMVGTTRARISFFMNKFRRLGLIEYNNKLKIHPSLLSVVLND